MATHAEPLTTIEVVRKRLQRRQVKVAEIVFQLVLLAMLLLSLLVLLVLLAKVMSGGVEILFQRRMNFITSGISSFSSETAGVWQGIVGSLVTLGFVVFLAVPLGVGAAVYLEEYAPNTRLSRFIDVNIRNLAGVPSIVYGLLGLAIFVGVFRSVTGGGTMISAGLTLGVLVLPLVIITSAEALRAVPSSIREAGYGVGATRWEVTRHHVLPSAAPGMLTGTVLSLARALGETAPVLLVGAVTGFLASGGASIFEQMRTDGGYTTLPTVIFQYASLPNSDFRAITSAAIIVLLAVILTANAAAIVLRNRYERKW
jgi:phosphate transport system permease protein